MKVENGKIVECTEIELFHYYLTRDWDTVFPFDEYKRRCAANGTKITNAKKKGGAE